VVDVAKHVLLAFAVAAKVKTKDVLPELEVAFERDKEVAEVVAMEH
jgi:hypothetical protein